MKAIALIITIIVGILFATTIIDRWHIHETTVTAITATLQHTNPGYMDIHVFPLSDGCFTYNALDGEHPVAGTICLGEEE